MKNKKLTRLLTKYGVPLAIIILGILLALYFVNTKPKSKRKPHEKLARLVETISINPTDTAIKIKAMGTVVPERQIDLKPQVTGKIIEVSPTLIPGGNFQKGLSLMKIEPDDYQLIVEQRQSDVTNCNGHICPHSMRPARAGGCDHNSK